MKKEDVINYIIKNIENTKKRHIFSNKEIHKVLTDIYVKVILIDEIPKSKWIVIDERVMCQRCTFKHERWIAKFGFCPNCGAEMEREVEE